MVAPEMASNIGGPNDAGIWTTGKPATTLGTIDTSVAGAVGGNAKLGGWLVGGDTGTGTITVGDFLPNVDFSLSRAAGMTDTGAMRAFLSPLKPPRPLAVAVV